MKTLAWFTVAIVLASCAGTVPCAGDLENVGAACRPTFDGTEAGLPPCLRDADKLVPDSVWACQDLIVYHHGSGFTAAVCYYDASSHALVGAETGSDIGSFCDGTSTWIQAGRINPACKANAPTITRTCPGAS